MMIQSTQLYGFVVLTGLLMTKNLRNLRLINDLRAYKSLYNCRETFTDVMSALQIKLFLQNKPKFQKVKFNVNKVLTTDYEQMDTWSIGKKQSQTNPNKAKSKKAKMNVTYFLTKGYEKILPIWAPKKQSQILKRQKTMQPPLPQRIMKKTAISASGQTNPNKAKQTQFLSAISVAGQTSFTLCEFFLLFTFLCPCYNLIKRAGQRQAANVSKGPAEHLSSSIRYNINMSAANNRRPILILGIGNILLRDEGVGVRVIERMQKIPLPDNVELVDGGTAGADLLDVLADRRKVIIIDAVQADCEPGTVLRFTADDLVRPDGVGMSLHELGLGEALIMTKQLGCEPKEVVVFGIKPRDISCGLELSEQISASLPKVVELVLAEISK